MEDDVLTLTYTCDGLPALKYLTQDHYYPLHVPANNAMNYHDDSWKSHSVVSLPPHQHRIPDNSFLALDAIPDPAHSQRPFYQEPYQYHDDALSSKHDSYESFPDASSVEFSRRQEIIERVRHRYNIPNSVNVNLNAIPDPPLGQKPSEKHAKLVHLAIAGSPNLRLSLGEIYLAIQERFPYYKNLTNKKWQVCELPPVAFID
ncbi:hypothetical protein HHX47_DHR5000796 [Lentinula edodes]|nr:hypothetical protein HHX47_DHR5000796 [Lentinula edodes]